jgi:protein phosphatase
VVDVFEREPQVGEFYLLCSDGLSGLVVPSRMDTLFRNSAPEEIVAKCIKEAKDAGGDDNISVILIKPKLGG